MLIANRQQLNIEIQIEACLKRNDKSKILERKGFSF